MKLITASDVARSHRRDLRSSITAETPEEERLRALRLSGLSNEALLREMGYPLCHVCSTPALPLVVVGEQAVCPSCIHLASVSLKGAGHVH